MICYKRLLAWLAGSVLVLWSLADCVLVVGSMSAGHLPRKETQLKVRRCWVDFVLSGVASSYLTRDFLKSVLTFCSQITFWSCFGFSINHYGLLILEPAPAFLTGVFCFRCCFGVTYVDAVSLIFMLGFM